MRSTSGWAWTGSTITTRGRGLAAGMWALAIAAAPAAAQSSQRTEPVGVRSYARITLDVLAAGRKLPGDVLGEHVWGGGAMVAVELRPFSLVGLSLGALGASTPQLNFKDQAVLNEFSGSAALVWHAPAIADWKPYASTGLARQQFKVEEPPANIAPRTTYTATTVGAGVAHDLTRFVAWKAELTAQLSNHRTAYGMLTGLSVRLSGGRRQSRMIDTLVVRDTTIVRDTVVMTRRTVVTDTVVVHDTTVKVYWPRNVTRVVRGEDIILTLKDANFDFAHANLRPEAFPVLDALASQLMGHERPIRILVTGHTDDIGSDAANLTLGRGRAQSVRDYLVRHGVAADRIETDSEGKRRPIATNRTAAGRQLNRRVVISRIP